MADEAGFLELLIANERIRRLLDVLADGSQQQAWVVRARVVQLQGLWGVRGRTYTLVLLF
jgi:hypothetical protein